MDKKGLIKTAFGGILENPIFVLVLGTCPLIAVSKNFTDAFLMGVCVTFVLLCSNAAISALRKVIPDSVRLPAYIMIIATFVTVLQLFLDKFMPDFYLSVGRFIALIVVNCIILGRAEAFAGKNDVLSSLVDAASMGIGYILAICLLAGIRQFLGEVLKITIFVEPAGGFIVFGLLMALFNAVIFKVKGYTAKKAAQKSAQEGQARPAGSEKAATSAAKKEAL